MAQAKTYRLLSPLTPPLTCDVFTSCSSSLVELSTLLYFPANRLRIPLPLLFPVADESKTPSSLFPPAYYVSKQTIANPEEMCERKREEGVVLTPTHLAIVMEYAAGGELFEEDIQHGRFSEDEDILAIFFLNFLVNRQGFLSTTDFRISTMFWEICHRDLKLENTLLDGNPTPQLKICDFGYSKSALLHSQPKSTVGTPAYIAPSCRCLVLWCYPLCYAGGIISFRGLKTPKIFEKTINVIPCLVFISFVDYRRAEKIFVFHPAANTGGSILHSDYVRVSADCRHLLSRIFVSNPLKVRVFILFLTIQEEVPKSYSRHAHEAYHDSGHKKRHPWFLKNMPRELVDEEKYRVGGPRTGLGQSVEEIMRIIKRRRLRTKLRGRRTDRNRTGSIPMMWMLMTWRTVGSSWRRSEERGNKTHKGDAMKAM
ncbi:hypothetical protein HPP92_003306 [Vanilla planifolia]|uniref:non-specific serine/threonine protein kinase n=1 Tax=Vanilla planifolia TaxID=51239 RepID=A0A835S1I7_VANPL|nr:hypothetical protein HPP92_003306 [Vanilla planifolia]